WPNGLKLHRDGRIFVADYKRGLVTIDRATKRITPVLERYHLEHLKAPNDLVFASNGDLYFTDQGLTGLQDPTGRLFRLRADGKVDLLLDNIPSPNGLVLDANEETIYLAATRQNAILRVPLMRDGTVAKVGIFIQLSGGSGPDGLAIDEDGNIAVAHVGMGCVWLFSRTGEPMFRVNSCRGHHTTNIAYGGADNKSLFITESESGSILVAKLPIAGRRMFSHS
ncbi:MAG: SMP-30/gluconolactonase/LRE family protein, partial [Casimicrobiaceae bacterium]